MMKVLIIGQGGREHALAWKIAQSPLCSQIWIAPGNAGTATEAKCHNIAIDATDITALLAFAQQQSIDITIVGPEAPLALGIVDQFAAAGLLCFGPSQAAARLESSKSFCKQFMQQHAIPCAHSVTFGDITAAKAYLVNANYPIVIKADGLAAGKGVIIADDLATATTAVTDMLTHQRFGDAGHQVVIEDFLSGTELSYIVMVDGAHILPLASSQDHKRLLDGDQGPNTGGMGAYSPAPLCTPTLEQRILESIIQPTVAALKAAGTPFIGFLYAGLMISADGEPRVLEFNCRLGDPETQPVLMRLQTDLLGLCLHATQGQLDQAQCEWSPQSALTVVLAAAGYPNAYTKDTTLIGLDPAYPDTKIFHAGTYQHQQDIKSNGGRVLGVTSLGDNLATARQACYQCVQEVAFDGAQYRHDIGHHVLN